MTKTIATLLLFFGFAGCASACATLGEQLTHDEPVVKAKLSALKPGERLAGIRLCDNSSILGGWQFIRHAKIQGAFQHVLLFRDGRATRAVAWVERHGKKILVPTCPYGLRCAALPEAATVVSGDVYTFNAIKPKGDLVIVRYPPATW
jgi:hypothetical protein